MLKDKVAIITGASRGIGQAIAKTFASHGAKLAICSRSEASLKGTVAELEAMGVEFLAQALDVSNSEQADAMVKATIEKFGRVDILVNNAGITRDQLLMRMSEDDWNEVIAINLKGTFNFCKAVTRPMIKQRDGVIINVSSVVGVVGNAGQVNYAASKAGVIGMTKSIARELSAKNVRANVLAPGFIKTDMTDKLNEQQKAAVLTQIPLGRMGESDDIAQAALFLASPMSSYITGQVLLVDGGMAI